MKRFIGITMLIALLVGCQDSVLFDEDVTEPALKSAVELVVPSILYPTIQDAVFAAEDGTTILVKEGIYPELVQIHFRNNLTIVGQNAVLCPPDEIVDGDGVFNIDVTESSNIIIKNLKFDGKIESKNYPVYCAIGFTHSSGEASFNKITGYGQGVVSWNPNPEAEALSLKVSNNTLTDCMSGFEIQGNYDVSIEQNNISYEFDHSQTFDHFFPFWHGILMEGGTGLISKNKIKFKGGSEFLKSSSGVRLVKRDPAPHMAGGMKDLHDVDVLQSIIKGTDIGIVVNSDVPLYDESDDPLDEEWCVMGVRLLYNTFVQVEELYEINNKCAEVVIVPLE